MRPSLRFTPLLFLAACHGEEPDWAKAGRQVAVPAQVCAEVGKGIAQLRASGGIEVGDKGEATVPADAWNAMPSGGHDQLLKTLAFHASCTAGTQSDAQEVVVRGEDGAELARRAMSTRIDTSELLRN
jgi:hypothetical protein